MRERSGLVIVQKDEGALLGANVAYHLSMGVSRIVVVDNCSEDLVTLNILRKLSDNVDVTVLYDKSQVCDQAGLANWDSLSYSKTATFNGYFLATPTNLFGAAIA
jgi:hypothetical protein